MQKEGFGTWGCGIRNSLSPFSLLLGFFFICRSSNVQLILRKRWLGSWNCWILNAIKIFIQIQKFGYRFIHFILKAFKVIHHHDIMTERICRKMTLVGHNHHTYLLMLTIWFSIWFDRNLTVFVYIYSWFVGKLAKYLIWVE